MATLSRDLHGLANCKMFPVLWLLQLNFKEETRLLIVTAKNCKAGAKKSKQGRGNKLWIGEFRRTLRPGVCNYKTETPPRLMNVWCRPGMLVMCYLLLAFMFCISLSLLSHCLHIRLLLELCPWQGRYKHPDIIEYWLYSDEGDWVNVSENIFQSGQKI